MLARHLVWPSSEFLRISADDQDKFYEEVGELQKGPDGQQVGLSWAALRDLLKKALAKRQVQEQQTLISEGGAFQPLSYYATQGYDIEAIRQNTHEQDKQWHPVLKDYTYRLSIISIHYSDIEKRIEDHISQLENEKKEKKKTRKGRGPAGADESSEEAESKPDEPPALASMSEKDFANLQKKQAREAEKQKNKQLREDEKHRKKLQKEVTSHNAGVIALATKSRPALGRSETSGRAVLKHPKLELMPAVFVEKLLQSTDEVTKFRDECDTVLGAVKKATEKGARLSPLSFTRDDVAAIMKLVDDNASALSKMLALLPK